jgi:hypothetical protein
VKVHNEPSKSIVVILKKAPNPSPPRRREGNPIRIIEIARQKG